MSDAPVQIPTPGQPAAPATQPQTQPWVPVAGQPAQPGVAAPVTPTGATPAQQPAVPATQQQQPPATPGPATTQQPPATPGAAGADPIASMTPEQLTELSQRIEAARANRPPSLIDQITALQQQLTDTHRGKDAAVDQRRDAAAQANELEATIAEIKRSLRRTELIEAATVAQFANPQVVADSLLGRDGDVTGLIAAAAQSGGFAMRKPSPSAAVGGPASSPPPGMDPGIAALVEEIRQAHGG